MRKIVVIIFLLSCFTYNSFSEDKHSHGMPAKKLSTPQKKVTTKVPEKQKEDTADDHEKHEEAGDHEKHEEAGGHEQHEEAGGHEKHEEAGAHEKDEESGKKVGVGYGVEEYSEKLGFKLAKKTFQHFKIKTSPISEASKIIVPKSSIVQFKDEIGIFVVTNNFFKRVTGTINKTGEQIIFKSNQIKSTDQFVTEGADFLRIVEISLEGEGIQGHSH